MADTKIEWADKSWNPITGLCTPISTGCNNCYARKLARRLQAMGQPKWQDLSRFILHEDALLEPIKWKKPRHIFVCSMIDLFHEDISDEDIDRVLTVCAYGSKHTWLVLTKRPERMKRIFDSYQMGADDIGGRFPWPHVWLGVTAENQEQADKRIPILLQIPAAKRFVSIEPMLGPVDLNAIKRNSFPVNGASGSICHGAFATYQERDGAKLRDGLDWVLCGGESGSGARPMHPNWPRKLRDECVEAGVPFFFKQWGEWEIASQENRHCGSAMPESNKKYTWVGNNGKTFNPSAPDGLECYAMAKVGKKRAGRLLDGREWNERPGVKK